MRNDRHLLACSLEWYKKQLSVIEQFGSESGAAEDSARSLKENPRLLKGRALGNIGNAHLNLGDLPISCRFLEQALLAFQETGDKISETMTCLTLSSIYPHIGQIRKGQKFAKLHADLVASNAAPLPGQLVDQAILVNKIHVPIC